jgi:protein-disulfide isomerase
MLNETVAHPTIRHFIKFALTGWIATFFGLLLLTSTTAGYAQTEPGCVRLSPSAQMQILAIAARKFSTEPNLPAINHEAIVKGSCYLQLFLDLPNSRSHVSVFVTPDRRYISPVLWDIAEDIVNEDVKLTQELKVYDEEDHPPVIGLTDSPVTVVAFSDFQCPYCATFSQILNQYMKDHPGKLRVVFRNSPLPNHKWSKDAALAGICIAKQDTNVFWKFQDFMFSKQKEINQADLETQIKSFIQATPGLQPEKYQECITSPYPEIRLNRDLDEARAYGIHSTPTLFINGHRHGGFANVEDFSAIVESSTNAGAAKKQGGNN